ncbi:SLAM family member 6 isoform X1 [Ursus americanus]|uniref:SLAM family member 6 isoform X1 n=1 Tax=Ursus americanus TaxID=9643 RepID=UPI001E67A404|nr:SLAM family member 6 isoform X1 [Ursus americanus]
MLRPRLLLALVLLSSGNSAPQDSANPLTVNGILGESVTLSLKLPARDDIQSITWLHNGKSVTFILPKAAPDVRVSVTDTERKHRLQIMENYSLLLSNLTAADTGLYCAQITMQTSTEFSCYTLQVFRQLRNLRITNHTRLSDIGTCEIHLTCSVENSNDSLLRWHVVGNTSIKEANLTISWDPRNSSDQKYTCIAENPVSNIAFSVSTQSLCKGVLNTKNHPDTKWIIIVVTAILMCIIITIGLFVWRKKGCLWRTGKGREGGSLAQPLGCDHTAINLPRGVGPTGKCMTKPQGLAALPLQPLPPPHPLERHHLWAWGRVWEPLPLHLQISISLILFSRHLSFLYSSNPESCRHHKELRLCLRLSREHRVCLCHSSKQANKYPNTCEKQ